MRWLKLSAIFGGIVLVGGIGGGIVFQSIALHRMAVAIFPVNANFATTRDMAPVEMEFRTRAGTIHWRIPKAYLTYQPNWQGGHQSNITIEAALFWRSAEMPPWAIIPARTDPRPDGKLIIHVDAAGNFFQRRNWQEFLLPRLEEVGRESDLVEYRYRPAPAALPDKVFAPETQPENSLFFACVRNSLGNLLGCNAHTDFAEDVALDYVFSSNHIHRWREIDTRARALVASFLVSRN